VVLSVYESSPVYVYVSHNLISTFTNKLQFNFQCGMKRPFGSLYLYYNQIVHIMDILHGWNLTESYVTKAICLANIRANAHPLMKYYIEGFNYACDCIDFPIFKLVRTMTKSSVSDGVYCTVSKFITNLGQPVLATSVPLKDFVCDLTDRCPPSCQCVYRPENTTLHIYYSAANLSSLPLRQVQTGFLEQQTTSTSGTSSVLRQHLNLGRQ